MPKRSRLEMPEQLQGAGPAHVIGGQRALRRAARPVVVEREHRGIGKFAPSRTRAAADAGGQHRAAGPYRAVRNRGRRRPPGCWRCRSPPRRCALCSTHSCRRSRSVMPMPGQAMPAGGRPHRHGHRRQDRIGGDMQCPGWACRCRGSRAASARLPRSDGRSVGTDARRRRSAPPGAWCGSNSRWSISSSSSAAATDGRLGQAELRRRAREALLARNRSKGLQLGKRTCHGAAPCPCMVLFLGDGSPPCPVMTRRRIGCNRNWRTAPLPRSARPPP